MIFIELTREEFQEFSLSQENTIFYQSSYMADFEEKSGRTIHLLGIKENGEILAAGIFIESHYRLNARYLRCPRGFLADYNNYELIDFFIGNLKDYCKKNNYFMLKIDPYLPLSFRDGENNIITEENREIRDHLLSLNFRELNFSIEEKWIYILPLDKTKEELFKNYKPQIRNYIKQAQRNKIQIEDMPVEEFDIFENIMSQTGQRQGFETHNVQYYRNLKESFKDKILFKKAVLYCDLAIQSLNEEIEQLKTATYKKESQLKDRDNKISALSNKIENLNELKEKEGNAVILSVSCFMDYGNELIYLNSGNRSDLMNYHGSNLLMYEMINYAKDKNYKYYNFYGLGRNFPQDIATNGMLDFKKQYNGLIEETFGEFDLKTGAFYDLYTTIKKLRH